MTTKPTYKELEESNEKLESLLLTVCHYRSEMSESLIKLHMKLDELKDNMITNKETHSTIINTEFTNHHKKNMKIECSLCLETIQPKCKIYKCSKCDNKFHAHCWLKVLITNSICPLCRGDKRPSYIDTLEDCDDIVEELEKAMDINGITIEHYVE